MSDELEIRMETLITSMQNAMQHLFEDIQDQSLVYSHLEIGSKKQI